MKIHKLFLLAFAILLFVASVTSQQINTTVDAIFDNPGSFIENLVGVSGLVTQYVPETSSTTSYYIIKGDYGAFLKVHTAEGPPETNKKYKVIGILYVDPVSREAYISEKSRSSVEIVVPPPIIAPPPDYTLIYIIVALILVLIGILVYLQMKKNQTKTFLEQGPLGSSSPQPSTGPATEVFSTSNDYKTVRIVTSSPKTLQFIPGRLVITSGEDTGKSFRIAAYPTPEGSVVSIGREEVKGDRASAHIQIDNKFSTVSRKQAQLIYSAPNLFVRNLSETNLTQLDGLELKPNEKCEVKPNSKIRMGELEFQYQIP